MMDEKFDFKISNEDLLKRGINPYPRLTMSESYELTRLMRGFSLTANEHQRSSYLQRKACGMLDESEAQS